MCPSRLSYAELSASPYWREEYFRICFLCFIEAVSARNQMWIRTLGQNCSLAHLSSIQMDVDLWWRWPKGLQNTQEDFTFRRHPSNKFLLVEKKGKINIHSRSTEIVRTRNNQTSAFAVRLVGRFAPQSWRFIRIFHSRSNYWCCQTKNGSPSILVTSHLRLAECSNGTQIYKLAPEFSAEFVWSELHRTGAINSKTIVDYYYNSCCALFIFRFSSEWSARVSINPCGFGNLS